MFSRLRVSPREGADGFFRDMHGNAIFNVMGSCHFKGWFINVSFGDGSRIFWSKITIKQSVVSLHYTTCYDLCTNLLWIYDAFHSDFIVVL
jgi:cytochrome oxidase Cu insertion factor (SCO1/SenC/PrrC family)